MTSRIGFNTEPFDNKSAEAECITPMEQLIPRRSVVQVYFAERNMKLAYYNDQFDLKCGDLVYVDGKLEGMLGRVTEVSYNFKIKVSDYKRVIALVDTNVKGQFFMAGSHFVSFDRNALPTAQIITWFKAPSDEEFVSGSDDTAFPLENLNEMNVSNTAAERGHKYYMENKVRYICIDGTHGYAIVEGSKAYEVEFQYTNGKISGLTCSCFCSGSCKHQFAAMLQLRETLEIIEKQYAEEYSRTGYFTAVHKGTLFAFAVDGKDRGSFVL
ncbi:MAG: SWIM zinc finger domain-containing protein [Anaerovoracaceae bacterium]